MTTGIAAHTPRMGLANRLSQVIGQGKYQLWFQSARMSIDEEGLRVTVPNRFVADWIDTHFHDQLLAVAEAEIGDGAAVQLEIDPSVPAPVRPKVAPPAPRSSDAGGPAGKPATAPSLRHDLDSLVVGSFNELAYTAAVRVATEPDDPAGVLFVHGGCGLGKTHLLQGLCRRYAEAEPSGRWCYTTAEQFTNRYIQAVRSNSLPAFRQRLRKLDLLVVDDVHFLANKTATQNEFLHTFDAIGLGGARVVLASDAHPKLIEDLSEALTSRFLSGMVVRIEAPADDDRLRLIEALALRHGLTLAPAAVTQLAASSIGSIREMEGMLIKLSALARLTEPKRRTEDPIGAALVGRLLAAERGPSRARRPVRLDHILKTVCEDLNIEKSQALGRSRHRRVVLARSMSIYLARQLTTLSYPELARALGRPNHSTIVTAAQRIDKQVRERAPVPLIDPAGDAATMDRLAERLHRLVVNTADPA